MIDVAVSHDRRLSLLGAALSILASCLLPIVVLTGDVGLNVMNGWTIVLGLAAGLALLPERLRSVCAHTLSQVLLSSGRGARAGGWAPPTLRTFVPLGYDREAPRRPPPFHTPTSAEAAAIAPEVPGIGQAPIAQRATVGPPTCPVSL